MVGLLIVPPHSATPLIATGVKKKKALPGHIFMTHSISLCIDNPAENDFPDVSFLAAVVQTVVARNSHLLQCQEHVAEHNYGIL